VEVVPGRLLPVAAEGRAWVVAGFQQPTVLGLTRDPLRCEHEALVPAYQVRRDTFLVQQRLDGDLR